MYKYVRVRHSSYYIYIYIQAAYTRISLDHLLRSRRRRVYVHVINTIIKIVRVYYYDCAACRETRVLENSSWDFRRLNNRVYGRVRTERFSRFYVVPIHVVRVVFASRVGVSRRTYSRIDMQFLHSQKHKITSGPRVK